MNGKTAIDFSAESDRPGNVDRSLRLQLLRSFDSLSREVVDPRENESDWKTEDDCDDDEALRPIRYFERGKNLGNDLDEQPTDYRVANRNAVNFSSL